MNLRKVTDARLTAGNGLSLVEVERLFAGAMYGNRYGGSVGMRGYCDLAFAGFKMLNGDMANAEVEYLPPERLEARYDGREKREEVADVMIEEDEGGSEEEEEGEVGVGRPDCSISAAFLIVVNKRYRVAVPIQQVFEVIPGQIVLRDELTHDGQETAEEHDHKHEHVKSAKSA